MRLILQGDNLEIARRLPAGCAGLVYLDPPFNTGRRRVRTQVRTPLDAEGDRLGFQGKRYRTELLGRRSFADSFDDYLGFLEPRLCEARRLLAPDGSLFLHLNPREAHYAKVLLDEIFGRESFINEIIWAWDYGARTRTRWPAKHDCILWYARNPRRYTFNYGAMDRIPYLAPSLAGGEKARRGKTPTDVWWHTIVSPTGREKTGYPTQKPLGILRRIVAVHSAPGDLIVDLFAGSGTTGVAAAELGRDFLLVDRSRVAIGIMRRRLTRLGVSVADLRTALPQLESRACTAPLPHSP
jgi:site-specific DNA-methyltransferase (adenine-specific)